MAGRSVPTFTTAMLAAWLFFATVPLWIEHVGLYQYLGVEILIFATYALAFNLVLGHAGLPSFGHGAFFGIGAYAFGLAQQNIAPNLWLCLGVATLASALGGTLVALFISHRRGIYYALMTIAFGQIFWFVAIKSHSITGGEDGLLKIARLPADIGIATFDLSHNVSLYYFVLVVFMGGMAAGAAWAWVTEPAAYATRQEDKLLGAYDKIRKAGVRAPPADGLESAADPTAGDRDRVNDLLDRLTRSLEAARAR